MNIITLDFETFFSDEYTLSKLTTEEYVRDARFEAHGVGIRWPGSERTTWFTGENIAANLDLDWSRTACLCHHAHFDGLILSHHYGIKPAFWFDTLSMARLLIGNHLSVSLENLAKHFNLQAKSVPYNLFKGKHWHELEPHVQQQVASGCLHDCDLTWDIFSTLAKAFPQEEYALVDATVRMFTEPLLVGNTELLADIYQEESMAKARLLAELEVSGADIRKDWKFAELLRAEGVEPEQKPGKPKEDGTPRWNYSFAKTDDFMRELLDDENERVALLAEARLSEKSNITQTRTTRLGWMSTRGAMPVYLSYCGAHTTRWSGGDKVNWQNRKRGGRLEKAIEAPQGSAVVVNDASQIECRILNEVAGQRDVIERFRNREDPYVNLASQFYGRPITKADEKERGTGKQGELSCGYGAGGPTIKATAKRGTYGPPVYLTDEEALRLRDTYRATHPGVTQLWAQAGDVLKKMHSNSEFEWHCLYVKDKRIYLPNGAPLIYETLEWTQFDDGEQGWTILSRRGRVTQYGAKLVENIIQALARLHVSQAWLRCREAGIRMVSMEHDKLLAVVAEHEAQDAFNFMREEMSRPPVWLPNVPLDSEGYVSDTFAKPEKTL